MSLRDKLRSAEKKSVLNIRRRIDRAREEWADAERRIRQRMRIYPDRLSTSETDEDQQSDNAALRHPAGGEAAALLHDPEAGLAARKPIVSIHGRDVTTEEAEDEECGHLIQSR
jgi:hypothetical protein